MEKTLDEIWDSCLKLWKYIANSKKRINVSTLKKEWFVKNDLQNIDIMNYCYFCEYSEGDCGKCPAVLVDSTFDCMCDEYSCFYERKKFYAKLKELNKKRLKNGKKD